MLKYGSFIYDYDPDESEVHNLLVEYYKNPVMTKVKINGEDEFWAVRLHTLMINTFRYLIAITPISNSKERTTKYLSDLKWTSFQTRTIKEDWKLGSMRYEQNTDRKFLIPIKRTKIEEDITYYECEKFPGLEILLLPQRDTLVQYPETGTISRALETYHTVFVIS